jgi:hypothetical protein
LPEAELVASRFGHSVVVNATQRVTTQKNYRPGSGTTVLEDTVLVAAPNEIIRVMGVWIRRADARLASGAVRNAAMQVASHQQRQLDEARTLRDLRKLRPATSFTTMARHGEADGAVC